MLGTTFLHRMNNNNKKYEKQNTRVMRLNFCIEVFFIFFLFLSRCFKFKWKIVFSMKIVFSIKEKRIFPKKKQHFSNNKAIDDDSRDNLSLNYYYFAVVIEENIEFHIYLFEMH